MSNPFGKLPAGMGNIAQTLMEKARKVEAELATERVESSSGGGAVKAVANGKGELLDLTISKDVVDPEDVEMLQALIVTAVRDVVAKATEVRESRLQSVLPPGFNLPGLS